jgi:dsDNA-specific endonuclease/ATPase MutS2
MQRTERAFLLTINEMNRHPNVRSEQTRKVELKNREHSKGLNETQSAHLHNMEDHTDNDERDQIYTDMADSYAHEPYKELAQGTKYRLSFLSCSKAYCEECSSKLHTFNARQARIGNPSQLFFRRSSFSCYCS